MGYVLNHVVAEYNRVNPDAPSAPIEREIVNEAIEILRTMRVYRTREVFLFLSAINLLNAAIKQKEYKKELG